jgi:hypothetical protein
VRTGAKSPKPTISARQAVSNVRACDGEPPLAQAQQRHRSVRVGDGARRPPRHQQACVTSWDGPPDRDGRSVLLAEGAQMTIDHAELRHLGNGHVES